MKFGLSGRDEYEFRYIKGHIEVFLNGVFQLSADTLKEAEEELRGVE